MVPLSYGFVNHTWNGILWQDKPADRLIILGTTNLCVRVFGWVGCPKTVGSRSFSPWTLKDPYIHIYIYIHKFIYIYIPCIPIYSPIIHIYFPCIPPFSDQPPHACSKVRFIHAASPKGSAPLRRKKRHHWASWARGCRWDHLKPWGTSCWNSARNGSGKTLQSTPVNSSLYNMSGLELQMIFLWKIVVFHCLICFFQGMYNYTKSIPMMAVLLPNVGRFQGQLSKTGILLKAKFWVATASSQHRDDLGTPIHTINWVVAPSIVTIINIHKPNNDRNISEV